jgi:CheY-like chemotaxis protein
MSPIMENCRASFTILMAEDDPDDRFLFEQALNELQSRAELRFVEDGEELMEYLHRLSEDGDPELFPKPALILLDLNMPKKDGRQALVEIKTDPKLLNIPIVVWTTSRSKEDISLSQEAGVDAFVTKPFGYEELVNIVRELVAKYSFGEACST